MITLALTSGSIWANYIIMNSAKDLIETIAKFLKANKIATLGQLQAALDNPSRITIFRKLAEMEYISSYSHRGKFYTLKSIANFNAMGLWHYKSVGFSVFGNLIVTLLSLVNDSEAGYTATELKEILRVKTKHALTQLVRSERLQREKFDLSYVYLSLEPSVADRQRKGVLQ